MLLESVGMSTSIIWRKSGEFIFSVEAQVTSSYAGDRLAELLVHARSIK